MTRVRPIAVLSLLATLVGCAAPPTPRHTYTSPAAPAVASSVTHSYTVSAVDVNGRPVRGVTVTGTLDGKASARRTVECTTDDQGRCATWSYEASRDPSLTFVASYESNAKVEGKKEGYYTAKGSSSGYTSSVTSAPGANARDIKLQMLRPIDYLEDGFATSAADRELRERVLRFLDVIRLQSILNEGDVMLKGIGTSEFKSKKYLRVKINSTTTYNNLKVDRYGMGKALFDETVRKVLTPLNDAVAAPRAYYGYDIVVYGHSKNFVEKYDSPKKMEYRFLMPETSVRRYKDKDISGQALLDASVLLLQDERIDLKLQ
jgi:hypothetical protein